MSSKTNRSIPLNPVLHEQSAEYYWKGTGALSIKTFRGGKALYQAGHGHYAVEDNRYLLLNQGQEYSITIEADKPIESFCVFFPEGWMQDVWRNWNAPADELLNEPFNPVSSDIPFVMKTYEPTAALSRVLEQMRLDSLHKVHDEVRMGEQLHALASGLLLEHGKVCRDMLKLHSVKASTRQELYRRVYIGFEYVNAYFNEPISITEAAGAACLSTNHFLRCFKELFGVSPHQFLQEKRLQEAEKRLRMTDMPVTDICMEVGFQSLGSFSSLFARRYGTSPASYRRHFS
ncbi:helix-turn-helix domain-containing protein [Paenibacillus sp. HJL G12]|uniref:Helix-turn-helix domain-containing protein n=1 Tax=Paenibacillus dendrobii TaxID=2691084 RepID=A0A7X3LEI4_9BACL|nr:AraC family transcriptional regulator [Paenibacillus dendrobii]MWV42022.1 helix-turn-helix domain-containing protein [Paenibacillus dendrobii]